MIMRRLVAALALLASVTVPAQAQVFDNVNLHRLNRKLCGRVVDYTHNHGADRRLYSPILGRPRDLYVYLPPGYDPSVAYPLILFLHGADVDEHDFLDPGDLKVLDRMMSRGEIPPTVIAAPDGTYEGIEPADFHSFALDQRLGRSVRGPPRCRSRAVPDADLLDPPRASGARACSESRPAASARWRSR